jgi:hypothetical protein
MTGELRKGPETLRRRRRLLHCRLLQGHHRSITRLHQGYITNPSWSLLPDYHDQVKNLVKLIIIIHTPSSLE